MQLFRIVLLALCSLLTAQPLVSEPKVICEPNVCEQSIVSEPAVKSKPKVTFSMIMKNEAGRKLRECLEEVLHYINEALIIDDNSTDNSVEIAEDVLKDIPHRIIRNTESKFQQ